MKPPEIYSDGAQKQALHSEGPFQGLRPGDIVRVIYDGAPTSLMALTRIKRHCIIGFDGPSECKVTLVRENPLELRFYAQLAPGRQTVLRNVTLRVKSMNPGVGI